MHQLSHRNWFALALGAVVACLCAGSLGAATVRYCAPEPLGNDANDGLSPETPKTFNTSVSGMSNNDELRILTGTYFVATGSEGSHIFTFGGPLSFVGWDAAKNAPADPEDVVIDLEAKNGLFRSVRGLKVSNLTIQNANARTYPGGAICLATNASYYDEPAIVSNCSFRLNYAYSHGGGAISVARPATIVDCVFEGNTNDAAGGALYLTQQSKVIGCAFTGNWSSSTGGALYSSGSEIVGCGFTNNVAKGNGGAIYGSADIVRDCEIVSNLTQNCGGGYAWTGTSPTVFDHCLLSNNVQTANGNWACGGGAFFVDGQNGKISMTNCTVVCNSAACNGGALLMRNALLFEAFGCTFDGNYAAGTMGTGSASNGAGAWFWFLDAKDGSTNRFVDCTIRNNRWREDWSVNGGVVYSTAKTVLMSGCTFSNEVGQALNMYEFGGSVASSVSDCSFLCITNTRSVDKSGGVAHVGSPCTVTGCTFRGNRSGKCGLSTGGSAGTTNAYRNCVFANNYSLSGSLVSASGAFLSVADCTFTDNVMNDGYGGTAGGICISAGGKVAIDRCSFCNNTNDVQTGASGGALFLHSTSAADPASHVRNCLFDGNGSGWHANRFGPSICLYSGTTSAIPIENCTFVNHTLGKAPVQCLSGLSWAEANLINCAFAGNAAIQSTANFDHSWQGKLADAGFADAAAGNYCPVKGSQLVDMGLNDMTWMDGARDLLNSRKVPRVINDIVDIGCYEYRPTPGLLLLVK